MIAAGHAHADILNYTVPQFRLYLEAVVRRDKRAHYLAMLASQAAWADKSAMNKARHHLLDD